MSGLRIGGGEGSGLDRFQVQREQTLRRLRRGDMEARLQEAIQKKRGAAETAKTPTPATGVAGQYAKVGALERPDPKPSLGMILDILA